MVRRYRVVDVFAERRYEGNPLTVVLDAEGLTAQDMQRIARETNHSETTFVTASAPRDGAWPVRIFTPEVELPFAGHPTLGTAAVLRDALGADLPLALDLAIGRVPVREEKGLLWLSAPPATLGNLAQPAFAARCVNLSPLDLDARVMPQSVACGPSFLVVPVEKLAAARRARFDASRLRELMPRVEAEGVLVVCPETESPQARLHVRALFDGIGIVEDPATGSAAAALGAWLVETRWLGEAPLDLVLEQGLEIGRPSRLHVRARATPEGPRVEVGGAVVAVAEGAFL